MSKKERIIYQVGSLVFLFYQSKRMPYFDFVPVIPVSPDVTLTALKERC